MEAHGPEWTPYNKRIEELFNEHDFGSAQINLVLTARRNGYLQCLQDNAGIMPSMKPDKAWLENAIKVWAETVPAIPLTLLDEDPGSLADHILGNWLMVEQSKVVTLVEAARIGADAIGYTFRAAEDAEDVDGRLESALRQLEAALAAIAAKA